MLQLAYDNRKQRTDLQRNGGNLLLDDSGLETAVMISLFSNSQRDATGEQGADRGGWWGDAFAPDHIGSRLWVLARSKGTAETAAQIVDAAKAALAWLVTDGVAASVSASATWVTNRVLLLSIEITRPANAGVWSKTWEIPLAF